MIEDCVKKSSVTIRENNGNIYNETMINIQNILKTPRTLRKKANNQLKKKKKIIVYEIRTKNVPHKYTDHYNRN